MSWFNDGTWNGLDICDAAQLLYEICNAVNEREKLIGRGTNDDNWTQWYGGSNPVGLQDITQFYTANMDLKRFPTVQDFQGASPQAIGDSFIYNITYARAAIERLLDTGLNEDGLLLSEGFLQWPIHGEKYSAVFYKEYDEENEIEVWFTGIDDLLGMGSYGTSWIPLVGDSITNIDIWMQMKEAIEKLDKIFWIPAIVSGANEYEGKEPVPRYMETNTPIYYNGEVVNPVWNVDICWDELCSNAVVYDPPYLYSGSGLVVLRPVGYPATHSHVFTYGVVTYNYKGQNSYYTEFCKGTLTREQLLFTCSYSVDPVYNSTCHGLAYDLNLEMGEVTSENFLTATIPGSEDPSYYTRYFIQAGLNAGTRSTVKVEMTTPLESGFPGRYACETYGESQVCGHWGLLIQASVSNGPIYRSHLNEEATANDTFYLFPNYMSKVTTDISTECQFG